jgi:hypothetical protein
MAWTKKPDLLVPKQAAEFIGLPQSTLAMDRRSGRLGIPFYRLGRRVFYSESELTQWLTERSTTGGQK